ncbi:MAG: DUF1345 domain-containing protein [Novosphingobium sp.]|nr:DUF1345 domain-containing protein [Novosphingobium sp.]
MNFEAERAAGLRIGKRIAPPRFLLFLVLLPLAYWAHRTFLNSSGWADSIAMGFDFAAAVFLVSLLPILRENGAEAIRRHADANDANRWLVLGVATMLMVVVMIAISGELKPAEHGELRAAGKLVLTLLLIWLFANSVFALHYAHIYYALDTDGEGDFGGIEFPGETEPNYGDFAYFAFTLGMTFQTSDSAITSRTIRHVAILHSFAAYVFSIGVIAFTINALGGAK